MRTDDIVQWCVEEVLAGRQTAAECAAQFPDIADLEAILAVTVALRKMHGLTPRLEAQQKIEARLRARVLQGAEEPPVRRARRMSAGLIWAGVVALVVIVLAAGAAGTTAVSSQSVPGELLYKIKRADESAKVFLSPNSTRAFVYADLARRRLDELIVLSERGSLEAGVLNALANDMVSVTDNALAFVSETPPERQAEILNTLVLITDEQQTVLSEVKAQAPPEAQAGLDLAIQACNEGHEQALQQLEQTGEPAATGSPSPVGSATFTATATLPTETPTALLATGSPSLVGSPTITATATLLTETPMAPLATETLTPPGQTLTPTSQTNLPPSQTLTPPGQTAVPPSQTQPPSSETPAPPSPTQAAGGQGHVPPGQTRVPPGQTRIPPGQTHNPPGQTHVPPGQTKVPPGQTKIPPGQG